MVNERDRYLSEIDAAAGHALKRDQDILDRHAGSSLRIAVEAALGIRTNYAEGVQDMLNFMRTGELPNRLTDLIENYRNEAAGLPTEKKPNLQSVGDRISI